LLFHPCLGLPERARIATAETIRKNIKVRVPSTGHACHLSKVVEASVGYDKKHVSASRSQFEGHFGSIRPIAPSVTKQARRIALCDPPGNFT
jgi:hypothetical protein